MRRIEIAPSPEGPTLVASTDTAIGRTLLRKVAAEIPTSFPPNPVQRCRLGTTIAITTRTRTLNDGPCSWPASIERLRQALVKSAGGHPANTPTRPVSAAAWRSVLSDWYDGHMGRWHPCAAVLESIRHLPVDGPYSTVALDLEAYARAVC